MKIQLLLLLVLASQTFGQGSFRYVSHHEGGLFTLTPRNYDLNSDGIDDIQIGFRSVIAGTGTGVMQIEGELQNGTRVVTDSYYFGNVSILEKGQSVDAATIPVRTNMDRPSAVDPPYNWLGDIQVTGFSLGASQSEGSSGVFAQMESIIGIQLLEPDGYHNGWLRFEQVVTPTSYNIRIADWAYNLNPNEPILAGMLQVPEPKSWMMMALGLVGMIGVHRRRRR